jgi:hypothetical protein
VGGCTRGSDTSSEWVKERISLTSWATSGYLKMILLHIGYPVAARSKVWVWGRLLVGIAGSNPAGEHGYLSLMNVVCCRVQVCVSGWSLVQGSPTECGVSEWDGRTSQKRSRPSRAVEPWAKNISSRPALRTSVCHLTIWCKTWTKFSLRTGLVDVEGCWLFGQRLHRQQPWG